MEICVICARFSFTGVALAQVRLARALAEDGHDVDLIIGLPDRDHLPDDWRAMPDLPGVNVIEWGEPKTRRMLRRIRRYLIEKKPDILFSAEDHLNDIVLLAALLSGSRAKISCSSRVYPLDADGWRGPYSNRVMTRRWLFKQLTRFLMWRADALVCVSRDLAMTYRELFGTERFTWVHNIIVDETSQKRMTEPVDHPWFTDRDAPLIVAAGQLHPVKGFPDLIAAMRLLHDRGRRVRLAILGEGPLRAELEAQIARLGLGEWIWLAGRVDNVLKYFARGDVSVLSSYAEGMPNVLVEAMMCGCVPVATDCRTGPREVLQDGKYGYLVPMRDPDAMADAIERAFDQPIPAERLAEGIVSFERRAVLDRHFETLGLAPTHAS